MPDLVHADDVEIMVAGQAIVPMSMEIMADSLLIELPQVVEGDSVQIAFTTRIVRNAAVVELDLGLNESPGLWQDVEPAGRRSNVVLLPDLAGSNRLIDDLQISNRVVTPNGDGVNDHVELSFVVFKAQTAEPKVEVTNLAGQLVVTLAAEIDGPVRRFIWDGLNSDGTTVQPGVYLCRIDVNSDSGDATELRTVSVAY